MEFYTYYPFIQKRFAGGMFRKLLCRYLPSLLFFSKRNQVPLHLIVDEFLTLAFTERITALSKYDVDYLFTQIQFDDKNALDNKIRLCSLDAEDLFLISSIVIYMKHKHTFDYTGKYQLNELVILFSALKIMHRKKPPIMQLFVSKGADSIGLASYKTLSSGYERIANFYTGRYGQLYIARQEKHRYIELPKSLLELYREISKKPNEFFDDKLVQLINRHYASYKRNTELYMQIKQSIKLELQNSH